MTASLPPETPTDTPPTEAQTMPAPGRFSLRGFWGRLSLSNLQIILVVLTVIGGQLVIDFGKRIIDGQQKIAQQESLEAQIAQLQQNQQKLEENKAYFSSPSYVEEWAHSDGKMVMPGEKIVIPLYKGQPRPKQPQIPSAPPPPLAKWVTWWTLFFDTPAPTGQTGSTATNRQP